MNQDILQIFTKAINQFSVSRLIYSLIAILLAVAAILAVRYALRRRKNKINSDNDIEQLRKVHGLKTLYRIIKIGIIFICVLAVLQINGINITSIVMLIGILLAVVAVGVKDMLQDFFSGVIISVDEYFKVGDAVEFDGRDGIVIAFNLRTTKIELLDDRSILAVSNRNLNKVRKLTHLVDIDLPLSYDLDRREAFSVLEGICDNIRAIEGVESCELKGTQSFNESAIIYKLRFFCEPNNRPDIRREVNKTIQDGLAEAGIKIPYNQLDIHTK